VTEQETTRAGAETIAKPETIYVYPFAATQADVPSWTAAAIRYSEPSEPATEEQISAGKQLGGLVAKELAAEIRKMGLSAGVAAIATSPKVNDVMIIGYFEAVEQGSGAERVLLGFGSGSAELRTAVEGYQMTALGPRLLASGKLEASGNRMPGVIVPLAVLAATANPIGLVVTGTAKLAGEATGRGKIEGAAKRTAEEIADRLEERFKERGWID
jgi:hypothetical protein